MSKTGTHGTKSVVVSGDRPLTQCERIKEAFYMAIDGQPLEDIAEQLGIPEERAREILGKVAVMEVVN